MQVAGRLGLAGARGVPRWEIHDPMRKIPSPAGPE